MRPGTLFGFVKFKTPLRSVSVSYLKRFTRGNDWVSPVETVSFGLDSLKISWSDLQSGVHSLQTQRDISYHSTHIQLVIKAVGVCSSFCVWQIPFYEKVSIFNRSVDVCWWRQEPCGQNTKFDKKLFDLLYKGCNRSFI